MTWLWVLLIGLALDATGTWQVTMREGYAKENNPVLRWILARYGSPGSIAIHALLLGWVWVCWHWFGAAVGQNVAITLGVVFAIAGVFAWLRARKLT